MITPVSNESLPPYNGQTFVCAYIAHNIQVKTQYTKYCQSKLAHSFDLTCFAFTQVHRLSFALLQYYLLFKDFHQQLRAYIQNIDLTLEDDSELEIFIANATFSEFLNRVTRDERRLPVNKPKYWLMQDRNTYERRARIFVGTLVQIIRKHLRLLCRRLIDLLDSKDWGAPIFGMGNCDIPHPKWPSVWKNVAFATCHNLL